MPVVLASRAGGGELLHRTYGLPGSATDLLARRLVPVGEEDAAAGPSPRGEPTLRRLWNIGPPLGTSQVRGLTACVVPHPRHLGQLAQGVVQHRPAARGPAARAAWGRATHLRRPGRGPALQRGRPRPRGAGASAATAAGDPGGR